MFRFVQVNYNRILLYKKYFTIRNLFIFLNYRCLYFFIAGHECILKRSFSNIPEATTVMGVGTYPGRDLSIKR